MALLCAEAWIGKSRLDSVLSQGHCFRSDRFFPSAPVASLGLRTGSPGQRGRGTQNTRAGVDR